MVTSCSVVDIPISIPAELYAPDAAGSASSSRGQDAQRVSTDQPGSAGALDCVRIAFWQAYRHLFPPHSLAAQTPQGAVVISWSVVFSTMALPCRKGFSSPLSTSR